MASRLELHEMLCGILGTRNVYFQSPESIKMQYPAIRYSLSRIDSEHADDDVYIQSRGYDLILIDEDPDSEFIDKISSLPRCRFDRPYVADNLNHYVFTLYY